MLPWWWFAMPLASEFNDTGLKEDTPEREEFPDEDPFVWAAAEARAEARFCITTWFKPPPVWAAGLLASCANAAIDWRLAAVLTSERTLFLMIIIWIFTRCNYLLFLRWNKMNTLFAIRRIRGADILLPKHSATTTLMTQLFNRQRHIC